ncbi:MAG: alpha/beta hydrolase [Clostridiales bacterium]|nr:alpha/beta hydrolase [Clostridiales bacterium]
MPDLQKGNFMEQDYFLSSDGKTQVAYYIFENKQVKPKAIVQISHGMKEHIPPYKYFAEFLTRHGYIVVGNDDLGHGKTAKEIADYGFFADKKGDEKVVQDLHKMTQIAKQKYPNLPIFMFGHSMGSFFARKYASVYPNELDGYIFCGTSGHVAGTRFGMIAMTLMKIFKGKRANLKFLDKMMVKKYFKYIQNPKSEFEWVTSNVDYLVEKNWNSDADRPFTVSAYYDMVKTLLYVNTKKWAKKLNKNIPYLFVSGSQDPVGQYGNGIGEVYSLMEKQKIDSIDIIMYGTGRHQLTIEKDNIKRKFMDDVLYWLNDKTNKNRKSEK